MPDGHSREILRRTDEQPCKQMPTEARNTPPSRRRSRSTRSRRRQWWQTAAVLCRLLGMRTAHGTGLAHLVHNPPLSPLIGTHQTAQQLGLTHTTARGFRAWQLSEKHRLALERQAEEHHRDHGCPGRCTAATRAHPRGLRSCVHPTTKVLLAGRAAALINHPADSG